MGVQDLVHYVLIGNPVSSSAVGAAWYALSAAGSVTKHIGLGSEVNMPPQKTLHELASSVGPYIKVAGLTGAVAVILGAYGSHRKYGDPKQQEVFETANRYHFMHSLAFMGLPLCRAPFVTGTFFLSGILMFSGTCYYYAFTGDRRFNRLTPIGGSCLIIGWLSLLI